MPMEVEKAGLGEAAGIAPEERVTQAARASLSADGLDEVINYSFVAERDLLALGAARAMRLANPLTVEQGAMRTTILAGLLRNLGHNLARGARDLKLYELGRVYLPEPDPSHPSGPLASPTHEPRRLGLARTGPRRPTARTGGGGPHPMRRRYSRRRTCPSGHRGP